MKDYKLILDTLQSAVTVLDCDGEIIYANPYAIKLYGLKKKKELRGREYDSPQWKIKGLDGNEILSSQLPFALIKSSKTVIRNYLHYIEVDGQDVLLAINGAPTFDEKKNFSGAVITVDDITDDYEKKEQLLKKQRFLENMVSSTQEQYENIRECYALAVDLISDGVWDWDLVTGQLSLNDSWKLMLGYAPAELANHVDTFYEHLHPDDKERTREGIDSVLTRGCIDGSCNHLEIEFRMRCKDGSYKWILSRGRMICDSENRPVRFIGFHQDISEQKSTERYLENLVEEEIKKRLFIEKEKEKQQHLLIQQSKMAEFGSMIGAISHQWKQPLNAMMLLMGGLEGQCEKYMEEEILSTENTKEFFRHIRMMKKQVDFMNDTINDFQNFFKPASKATLFNPVLATQSFLSLVTPVYKKEDIDVVFTFNDAHVYLYGHDGEFKQILLSIFSNARDALNEQKKVMKTISIDCKKTDDENIMLVIQDSAGGIPDDLLPNKIFEPFFTTKGDAGSGYGLYLSKMITEKMKGTITASNVSKGAAFTMMLPLAEMETSRTIFKEVIV